MNISGIPNYEFECGNCGCQHEVDWQEDSVIKCSMCESIWIVEYIPGNPWLEPLQQIA